jgi:pimeloyl-ACP methyl ester carboxylesterase
MTETVILVPGLWMPKWGLGYLAHGLGRCGFEVHRFAYPSVRSDLRENAAQLKRFIERLDRPGVHLVGHSLGGLVIRALLESYPTLPVRRVVTLASPHHGSEVARRLARRRLGRRLLGRSVQDLLDGTPERWAPPSRPIGVIRGSLGIGLGRVVCPGLPRPNDGALSEPETRLDDAADEITLRVAHSGMLLSRQAVRQACCFLQTGRFAR